MKNTHSSLTLTCAWISLFVIALLLGIFDESHAFLIVVAGLLAALPFVRRPLGDGALKGERYVSHAKKDLLRSNLGHAFFGVVIGLFTAAVLGAVIFSLEGAWSGLSTAGFLILSFPLVMVFRPNAESGAVPLFLLALANLGLLTLLADMIGRVLARVFSRSPRNTPFTGGF